MIGELFSKIFSGALVGYATNDLAIQMLFRKRFGIGGLIIKTRQEFIQNVSQLVEREIINERTLAKEFESVSENFGKSIENMIADLLKNHLPNEFPTNFEVQNIPALEQTFGQTRQYFVQHISPATEDLMALLLPQIDLKTVFSEKQNAHFAKTITQNLKETLQKTDWLQDTLQNLHTDLAKHTISQFVPENILSVFTENLVQNLDNLHLTLQNDFSPVVDYTVEQVLKNLQIETLVKSLSEQIAEKKLADLLNSRVAGENTRNGGDHNISPLQVFSPASNHRAFIIPFLDIIRSEQGRKILEEFAKFLLDALQKEKTTIYALLSEDLTWNFEQFLRRKLPIFLETIIQWLEDRKYKLENLIDSTFRKNIKWKLQDWILDWFVGSVSQYANAVRKIVEVIEEHKQNPTETTASLTNEVINYLRNNTIGDMIGQFRNPQTEKYLAEILQENTVSTVENLKENDLEAFFQKKIGELVKPTDLEKFLQKLVRDLVEKELKQNFLYSPKISRLAQMQTRSFLDHLPTQKMGNLLTKKAFLGFAERQTTDLLILFETEENRMADYVSQTLQNQFDTYSLTELLNLSTVEQLNGLVIDRFDQILEKQYNNLKTKPLQNYLLGLQNWQTDFSLTLHKGIEQNLPFLVQGRVAQVVTNSMNKMSEEKLLEVVEKFMGKELRPITVFGAVLGGLAGLGLAFVPLGDTFSLTGALAAAAAYGIAGYGTNWLAIKMIFRPYEAKYLLPKKQIKLPFTPSVVAKNKPKFALNMGNFVVNGLLNPVSLQETFSQKKASLQENLGKMISENNYELLYSLLEKHKESIGEKTSKTLIKSFAENLDFLMNELETWAESKRKYTPENLATDVAEKRLDEFLAAEKMTKIVQNELEKQVLALEQNPKSLAEYLPANFKQNIYDEIGKIIKEQLGLLLEKIGNREKLSHFIEGFDPLLQGYTAKNLSAFLNENSKENLKQKVYELLEKNLIDSKLRQTIFDFIDEKLAKELAPDKEVKDLLNGNLLRLVGENLDFLVEKMIGLGLDWLRGNKEVLAEQIYQKAYESTKTVVLYKSTIKDTVVELADKGIPDFFQKETASLKNLIGKGVEDIGASKIGELRINIDKKYLKNWIDKFLHQDELRQTLLHITEQILEEFYKIPLQFFLQILDIQSVKDIEKILDAEIGLLIGHLNTEGKAQSETIGAHVSVLLVSVLENRLANTQVKNLLMGITEKEWKNMAGQWVVWLWAAESFGTQRKILVQSFFKILKTKPLDQLADWETLKVDFKKLLEKLLQNPENIAFLETSLRTWLVDHLPEALRQIETPTKDFVVEKLTNAILNALELHLSSILGSLDLRKIVVEEIEQMSAGEIEDLFNSFAKKYFTELINYGFGFGIAFGLASDIILYGLLLLGKEIFDI